jgi:hypothetical protein
MRCAWLDVLHERFGQASDSLSDAISEVKVLAVLQSLRRSAVALSSLDVFHGLLRSSQS